MESREVDPRAGHQRRQAGDEIATFLVNYFIPAGTSRFDTAVLEAVHLTHWYAREHVILCLLPAFIIAGAMAVFISKGSVLRYLGPQASKPIALGVGAVSGTLLAVCSCTVLPLFGGIYKRGAGLGAAIAFLYSGPAINIMAIVITAKVLGPELGVARALGAIGFAVVIGAIMHLIYRREEMARGKVSARGFEAGDADKPVSVVVTFFGLMVSILVFANWAAADSSAWMRIYEWKWPVTALLAILLATLLVRQWHWPVRHLLALQWSWPAVHGCCPGALNGLLRSARWGSWPWPQRAIRMRSGLSRPGVSRSRSHRCCWWAFSWPGSCWAGLVMRGWCLPSGSVWPWGTTPCCQHYLPRYSAR